MRKFGINRQGWIIFESGIDGGAEINGQPSRIDVAPTMAEILDVPLHPDLQGRVVGRSSVAVLRSRNSKESNVLFTYLIQ